MFQVEVVFELKKKLNYFSLGTQGLLIHLGIVVKTIEQTFLSLSKQVSFSLY